MASTDRPLTSSPHHVITSSPLHPRPDFQREPWVDLSGEWAFELDPQNKGWNDSWFLPGRRNFGRRIRVPYSWAAPLSGIGEEFEGAGWYSRELEAARPASSGSGDRERSDRRGG